MGIKVSGTASKKLKEILKRCRNLKEPMTRISVDMKNEIRGNIDNQHSFDGTKWEQSKRASKEGGKTLKDTGRLYNSFRNTAGRNYARVGTNVIYARTLNQGADKGEFGKVYFTVPQHTRRIKKYKKNGEPNHLAMLGYAPPHIKDLDKSFSEFSQDLTALEKTETIEFSEEDEQNKIDEFVEYLKGIDPTKVKLQNLFDVMWGKDNEKYYAEKLKEAGYTVEKTAEFSADTLKTIADTLGMIVTNKPVNNLTPEEIYSRAKAEFSREAEREETKKKIVSMFPPVMKNVMEFAIDKAFEEAEYSKMIEFSETEKSTMADKLKEFAEGDSPFKHLFENITKTAEFNNGSGEETPQEKAKRIANLY